MNPLNKALVSHYRLSEVINHVAICSGLAVFATQVSREGAKRLLCIETTFDSLRLQGLVGFF